jgi:flavin reductase (DIM6/NTAB) family NADH-FMN oxidoreductase RutF
MQTHRHFTTQDIEALDKRYRTNLINSLSGVKSLNLCATVSEDGSTNLAVFNSVVHVGANPPLLGMVMRPATVPRHTLSNILANKQYTLNHVHRGMYKKAHQTSASYDENISEFEVCGLTAQFTDAIKAPYVAEARIKLGMELRECIEIQTNGTFFIVGQILEIHLPAAAIAEDGFVDPQGTETMAGAGLDAYYDVVMAERLPYARAPKTD